jgi:diguanylate cyclase (GGDEF)-like protein/PAS domain S-box-containing protein
MRMSLATRVTVYFGGLFVVTLGLLWAVWYHGFPWAGVVGAGDARLNEAIRAMEREADQQRLSLKAAVTERRGDLLILAENRVLSAQFRDRNPDMQQDFERVAARLFRAYPDRYLGIRVVDPLNGRVLTSSDHEEVGQPYRHPNLIRLAARPGVKELLEQVEGPGGATIVIIRQITAPDTRGYPGGRVVGLLMATLDNRVMYGFSDEQGAELTRWRGKTTLFDASGRKILTVGQTTDAANFEHRVSPQVAPGFEGTLQGVDALGRPTIQVFRHVPLTTSGGWTLLLELSVADALDGLHNNTAQLVLVGGALSLLALLAIALSSQRLTRSVAGLADVSRLLGQGQYEARTQVSDRDSKEIVQLARAFNDMAANLQAAHQTLEQAVWSRTNELEKERDRAQSYLDIAGVLLMVLDRDGCIAMVNAYGARKLGVPASELVGSNWFNRFVPQAERELRRHEFMNALQRPEPQRVHLERPLVDAGGRVRLYSWNQIPLTDANGSTTGMLVSAHDISVKKHMEEEMRIAAIAFESQQAMYVADLDWRILKINRAFTTLTGYSAEEALGRLPRDLLSSGRAPAEHYAAIELQLDTVGTWQGELWDKNKAGHFYPVWMLVTAVANEQGQRTHYVVSMVDITERKTAEDEIRNLAFYDSLTELPNRRLLLDRLDHAIALSDRSGLMGALLFVDLDNFKTLNDSLGHDMGDLLLQQVAKRLSACVRVTDTVARLGGDEFVVLLQDLSAESNEAVAKATAVGEKMLASLNQPYLLDDTSHFSSPSIGVTMFGDGPKSRSELLKRADAAMYQAKGAGRNTLRFFDPQTQLLVNARLELERDLREAIRLQQFVVLYQAQVAAGGAVFGAELLLRWLHPEKGLVPPGDFIQLAEESRLIIPMGAWVMEQACTTLAQWAEQPGLSELCLSVNVSACQLHADDFVVSVQGILNRTGANPRLLKIELTESLLVNNFDEVVQRIETLKALGVGFSIDDFGTGYSSLSYLKRLPLDQLKIDQSFVRDILIDPNDAAIAKMVIALAESLGLLAVAEGVETPDQQAALEALGCRHYQGYWFSRPVPRADFERYALSCVDDVTEVARA